MIKRVYIYMVANIEALLTRRSPSAKSCSSIGSNHHLLLWCGASFVVNCCYWTSVFSFFVIKEDVEFSISIPAAWPSCGVLYFPLCLRWGFSCSTRCSGISTITWHIKEVLRAELCWTNRGIRYRIFFEQSRGRSQVEHQHAFLASRSLPLFPSASQSSRSFPFFQVIACLPKYLWPRELEGRLTMWLLPRVGMLVWSSFWWVVGVLNF